MDPEDSKLDPKDDSRLDPDDSKVVDSKVDPEDSKVDPDDPRLDPSSKKRVLESEGREEDKKRHNSEKLSVESPLAEPSFADWKSSSSESELEDFFEVTELRVTNLAPGTTKDDLKRFFGAVDAWVGPEANPVEEKPDEEEKPEVKTKLVGTIWLKSREAKIEALKRNGAEVNGVPIRLTRVANDRIVLSVRGLDCTKSELDIKAQLTKHFELCGDIKRIFIPKDDNGNCLSFGYVFMNQEGEEAERKNLSKMGDCVIKVEDCTFYARLRKIKAQMEAEGWVNSEVSEDEDEEGWKKLVKGDGKDWDDEDDDWSDEDEKMEGEENEDIEDEED